jgi:outer membrane protein assembly factor BamD
MLRLSLAVPNTGDEIEDPVPSILLALLLSLTALPQALAADDPPAGVAPGKRSARAERLSAEESYNLGMKYLKRGYYQKALEQLNRVRTYYRDDPYALKAELAIAEVHFERNEFDAARTAYEDYARAHPRSPDMDRVIYRLGLCQMRKAPTVASRDQTWTVNAVRTLSGFEARFPASTLKGEVEKELRKARARLARKELVIGAYYYKRGSWKAAIGRLAPMLEKYPQSPDRPEALGRLGIAQAKLGNGEAARSTLEKLKAEAPSSPWVLRLSAAVP